MEASLRPLSRGNAFATAMLAALGLTLALGVINPSLRPAGLLRDFDAFYCAGRVLRAGADPYRAEPLGACERDPKPAPLLTGLPGLTMPAPLPPYALAPFRLLAALPYAWAALLWTVLGLGSVALTIGTMRALTGLPAVGVAAAFALTDGYASLCLGQIAPLAVAAIAVAAYLLARGRDSWAGVAASVALVEPHLGLPLCAGLFIFRPGTRFALLGAGAAWAALSFAAGGVAATREYVAAVLPAHALSEVANEKQFSLTYALFRAGVAPETALRAGELWYAVAVLLGLAAARRIAPTAGPAAYAVVPPALAIVGGPFVHVVQLAAAVPALLVLHAHGTRAPRPLVGAALATLAIPWIQFANLGLVFVALAAIAGAVLVHVFVDERPLAALGAAVAAALFLVVCIAAVHPIADVSALLLAHADPAALAETSWALYVRAIGTGNAFAFDLAKAPAVIGLVALVAAIALEAGNANAPASRRAFGGKGAAPARRTPAG